MIVLTEESLSKDALYWCPVLDYYWVGIDAGVENTRIRLYGPDQKLHWFIRLGNFN